MQSLGFEMELLRGGCQLEIPAAEERAVLSPLPFCSFDTSQVAEVDFT